MFPRRQEPPCFRGNMAFIEDENCRKNQQAPKSQGGRVLIFAEDNPGLRKGVQRLCRIFGQSTN